MNYQRSTTEHKRFGLRTVVVFMMVLVALVCCFTVSVSAAAGDINKNTDLAINAENASVNERGELCYTKVYDGTNNVVGTVSFAEGFDVTPYVDDQNVTIKIDNVVIDEGIKDVGYYPNAMTVTFKLENNKAEVAYEYTRAVTLPVEITPAVLTWTEDMDTSASVSYQYDTQTYTVDKIGDKTLAAFLQENLNGVIEGETVEVDAKTVATLKGVNAPGTYAATVELELGNYTVAPLTLDVTVEKLTVSKVDFGASEYVYGDDTVHNIEATVTDSAGKTWIVPVGYLQKNADGEWVEVDRISGDKGEYKVYLPAFSDVIDVPAWDDEENGKKISATVQITHKKYKVQMNNVTYVGDADLTTGENTTKFYIGVTGVNEDIPESILSQIKYTVDGKPFNGTSEYGTVRVTAKLPVSANDEFSFVNASGKKITSLSATITVNRLYLFVGAEDGKVDVVVMNDGNGFAEQVVASTVTPEFDRTVLRGYPVHSEFTLKIEGVSRGSALTLYIPLNETLYSKNVSELSEDDLYVFDSEKNELVKANELYTITLQDGYYRVEGFAAAEEITFVTAPEYHVPFFLSAPGIALITMIILVIVVLLFYIGLKARKSVSTEDNGETVVDTVGERYEGKMTMIENAPASPRVNVDGLIANLEQEEVVLEDTEELVARTRDEVGNTLQNLTEEVAKIVLPQEDLTRVDEATNALAARLSDELGETVDPDSDQKQYDVDDAELNAAVAEAMNVAMNESADATDAVAVVVEEAPEAVETIATVSDEDDDNDDDDDEDDGSFGFNTA